MTERSNSPSDVSDEIDDAGLVYVADTSPGFARRRAGKGFRYLSGTGEPITSKRTLERIKSLVIPPAWTDVWICPTPRGHIQATGRDERGRKQYIYHPDWRATRDASKFARLSEFGRALPTIRKCARKELLGRSLSRERVLAVVVLLLDETLIRVGNETYAQANRSFGLTTLRDRHVDVNGRELSLRFPGKGGILHEITLSDPRLARYVKRLQELPGQEIFRYVADDGEICPIRSEDVNEYLRGLTGADFTSKDFRTWAGTVLALEALREENDPTSEAERRRMVNCAIDRVAKRLGNTRAICRSSYIHPAVFASFADGSLQTLDPTRLRERRRLGRELSNGEMLTLALLEGR
jgi:DNA topoisomerase I